MSNIEEVKKLRKLSGAGFKDCLSALNEAEGNLDKALESLFNKISIAFFETLNPPKIPFFVTNLKSSRDV